MKLFDFVREFLEDQRAETEEDHKQNEILSEIKNELKKMNSIDGFVCCPRCHTRFKRVGKHIYEPNCECDEYRVSIG